MKASVAWINDYLDRPATADEIAECLTACGLPVESREHLASGDVALEVELTSNRGDCLCHVGLAREVATATGRTLVLPDADHPEDPERCESLLKVSCDDSAACPRYTARVIRGVTVGPSPEWMQERLRAIGQIPRNAIVDCTNYVLFELGQPTHAFDLARLQGGTLQVRRAREGESLLPIGEGAKPVDLAGSPLVIADGERPVAIAGVKGGAETAVHAGTTDIVIESAAFNPVDVRHASRSLRIASDSSYRFERGVDAAAVDWPARRLVSLILKAAGGRALAAPLAAGAAPRTRPPIELRIPRLRSLTGVDVGAAEARRVLESLGCTVSGDSATLRCTPPAHRMDIDREVDLIEEVLRIVGIDRVPVRDAISMRVPPSQPEVDGQRALREALVSAGFAECVTHTLVSERAAEPFVPAGAGTLTLADDRTAGEPVLRPSVVPSLLQCVARNRDHGAQDVRLFEIARTFSVTGERHAEAAMLSLVVAGPRAPEDAYRTLRGALERAVQVMCGSASAMRVSDSRAPDALSGALVDAGAISVRDAAAGSIGVIDARVAAAHGIEGAVAAAEVPLGALLAGYPPSVGVRASATHPAIDRDLSVIVDDAVTWSRIESCVARCGMPNFERVDFVGTYRGPQVGAGRKSLTMRLLFRADDRTLRREEVDAAMQPLVPALVAGCGAEVRS
jgi:phenylalanyl-tRNA synthetase beta chain